MNANLEGVSGFAGEQILRKFKQQTEQPRRTVVNNSEVPGLLKLCMNILFGKNRMRTHPKEISPSSAELTAGKTDAKWGKYE